MTGHLGVGDWTLEPTVTFGLLGLVVVYAVLMRRGQLSSSDDVSPWFASVRLRPVFFAMGIISGFVALASPIDTGGDTYLLSLHMVQHLVLMMVAPPLVLLGICGAAPVADDVAWRWRGLWTWLTRPWPATLLFNAVLLVWHIPALYDATLTTEPIHVFEHLTFIAVGVIFWWPIVDPLRRRQTRPVSPFQKIAMLVLAGIPPTVLGFVLALGQSPYYDFYARAPRLWGISAVSDQQLAGVIMLGVGNLIYFAAISVIFLRLFGDPAADEREAARAPRHAAG
jgi:putative membrane protein